jgi:hypothetical protein
MDPVSSVRYTGVILPVTPEKQGFLPFGGHTPAPTSLDNLSLSSTVFIPGDSHTTMIEGSDRRVIKYLPTVDNRTLSNQVGLYAVLVPHPDTRLIATVLLPPDVASFVNNTPPIEGAIALLEALLSRLETWSLEGCRLSGKIIQAIVRVLATYQKVLASNMTQQETVDLHVYLAVIKTIFTAGLRLLGGRAFEATGTFTPLVLQDAKVMIDKILNPDVVFPDGSRLFRQDGYGEFLCWGGIINYPVTELVGEILEVLTQGVLLP